VYLADWFVLLHGLSGAVHAGLGLWAGLALGHLLRPLRRPALPVPRTTAAAPPMPVPRVTPGTPVLAATGLAMSYAGADVPALLPTDLTLHAGEIVLLGGPSGSGKTTLLRLLQGLLPIPPAATLRLHGRDIAAMSRTDWVRQCGLLFQEPALQVVRPTVRGDVGFGRSLRGEAADADGQTHPAVAAALDTFGIGHLAPRGTGAVSGGELQRVALAGLWVERPAVLLLDEPLAHQDVPGRERLRAELAALSARGSAVLVAEHRLEPLLPVAHRVLWLEDGRVTWQGSARAFQQQHRHTPAPLPPRRAPAAPGTGALAAAPLVMAHRLVYRADKAHPAILNGIDLCVPAGRRIALTGVNGAGKSTLLSLLVGLRRPTGGSVLVGGRPAHRLTWRERARRFGYLPQQAELVLHAPTVREELHFAPRQRGLSPAAADALADEWLAALRMGHAAERFPHLLSRGERQRLALAAVLAGEPDCLVLDEPFAGQDAGHMAALLALCERYLDQDSGRSIVVATHDLAAVHGWFDEVWSLAEGALAHAGPGAAVHGATDALPREVPA
jgi:energy-coupling factor transport system ATP-binding protein